MNSFIKIVPIFRMFLTKQALQRKTSRTLHKAEIYDLDQTRIQTNHPQHGSHVVRKYFRLLAPLGLDPLDPLDTEAA